MSIAQAQTVPAQPAACECRPIRHLMRATWLQARRRNEFIVVVILLGLFLLGGVILRIVGVDSPQAARFVTSLGFDLGSMLAALLVLIQASRQIPAEIEQRTIYPVLAKPLTRAQLLAGRGVPIWLIGCGATVVFSAVTLGVVGRGAQASPVVLAQALACKAVALATLTALAMWLSLLMPAGLAMLTGGVVAFGGSWIVGALAGSGRVGEGLARMIPDLQLLEQFDRFVNGGLPLGWGVLAGLLAYGALWCAIFAGAAVMRFRAMQL